MLLLFPQSKVRIFTADIIYHLGDAFVAHMRTITEQRKAEVGPHFLPPSAPVDRCLPIVGGAMEGEMWLDPSSMALML